MRRLGGSCASERLFQCAIELSRHELSRSQARIGSRRAVRHTLWQGRNHLTPQRLLELPLQLTRRGPQL